MPTAGLYFEWRARGSAAVALRESQTGAAPPERWLQEIWAHQRLRRDELRTTGGQKLAVLHPGFWNREAGPDFRDAVIQIDDGEAMSGDIEIDVQSAGWKSHGHAQNPAYEGVILHVVWDAPKGEAILPTLVMREFLDAPIEELESWVGGAGDLPAEWLKGQCAAPMRRLSADAVGDLLRQAALARLETKGRMFRARARAAGWHQALWEGVFRALGYKHNAWPMQRLAEQLPPLREHSALCTSDRDAWEALLLGLSGLLPSEPRAGTRGRRLWDLWWRERGDLEPRALPSALWRLHGVRPVNHPQRRLALAAAWVSDPDWERRLDAWFAGAKSDAPSADFIEEALRGDVDGFWKRHYTLSSRALSEPLPLLGSGRANDLAVNAILPWFWARADAGNDEGTRARVQALYLGWPAGEDNAVLRLARERLFGGDAMQLGRTAAVQQGLLQIVRDFCSYSNALCDRCAFPSLVGALVRPGAERQDDQAGPSGAGAAG